MSTEQKSINSGFGATTTAAEVLKSLDLSNRVGIVTGGYSGIGLETARVLSAAGSKVIAPARNLKRSAAATKAISGIEIQPMNLMDPPP